MQTFYYQLQWRCCLLHIRQCRVLYLHFSENYLDMYSPKHNVRSAKTSVIAKGSTSFLFPNVCGLLRMRAIETKFYSTVQFDATVVQNECNVNGYNPGSPGLQSQLFKLQFNSNQNDIKLCLLVHLATVRSVICLVHKLLFSIPMTRNEYSLKSN